MSKDEPLSERTKRATMLLYSAIGKMREETYRTVLEPRRCLDNIEDIGHRAQVLTTDLYHQLKGD